MLRSVMLLVLLLAPCRATWGQDAVFQDSTAAPKDGKSMYGATQWTDDLDSDTVVAAETLSTITGGTILCIEGFASVFPCRGIDLASFIALDDLLASGDLSDIWGWHDPATGHEYAIVTQETGTTFVDITDPENPILVGVLPIHSGSNSNVWHDVRVYGDHAYIVADAAGSAGVQIFDLTQLASAGGGTVAAVSKQAAAPTVFSETAHYGGIASAHNLSVNLATGFAYVVGSNGGGTTCGGGLHMLDLSTPTAPVFAGCFADAATGRASTGYSHDVQCVVYHGPDAAYQGKELCFSSNETHIVVADVTNKSAPTTISTATYPESRYIHQGWLTDDHRFFLQDDELDELYSSVSQTTTYVWDVQDLDDPVLVDTFVNPLGVIDHNQFVLGRYAIQANYTAGLRVLDLGDLTSPSEILYFDTYPSGNPKTFLGAWGAYPYLPSGVILVSSIDEGLFVLKPAVPLRLALDLRVFLEGPYVGSDSMATGAPFQAALPLTHPYATSIFSDTPLELDLLDPVVELPAGAIDWMFVELRATASGSPVTTEPAILLWNGRVVAPDGDTLRFDGALPGIYWVVVRHRNHLAVMSSAPVDLTVGSGAWDFTDGAAKAYGTNGMKALGGGRFGMFASDGSIDGIITAPDFNAWSSATSAGASGYQIADYNMDGLVTAPDFNLFSSNTSAGAASQVPD